VLVLGIRGTRRRRGADDQLETPDLIRRLLREFFEPVIAEFHKRLPIDPPALRCFHDRHRNAAGKFRGDHQENEQGVAGGFIDFALFQGNRLIGSRAVGNFAGASFHRFSNIFCRQNMRASRRPIGGLKKSAERGLGGGGNVGRCWFLCHPRLPLLGSHRQRHPQQAPAGGAVELDRFGHGCFRKSPPCWKRIRGMSIIRIG